MLVDEAPAPRLWLCGSCVAARTRKAHVVADREGGNRSAWRDVRRRRIAGSRLTLQGAVIAGAILGAFTTAIVQCGSTESAAPPPAELSTPGPHSDIAVEPSSTEVAALIQHSVAGGDALRLIAQVNAGGAGGQ